MTPTTPSSAKIEVELRAQKALLYLKENPNAKVATVARKFNITRQRLQRRCKGITARPGMQAANTKLSAEEEVAICHYINRLDNASFAVRPEFITDAANYILKERSSSTKQHFPTVGQNWTSRFISRHGYSKKLQKKLDSNRYAAEEPKRVESYFQQLQEVITNEGLIPDDIWNMDETGFRIGAGKDQLCVTKRRRAQLFSMPENRESATAIEAISAGGAFLPAFLILSGQNHMASWYSQAELDDETVITVSPTGYSNDEISLHWLKHFHQHAKSVGRKRLLILDGHGSHHTIEFIEFCQKHDIIPFSMPPHLTHLLQPLDVAVFQPLKHYHAKELDYMVRDGLTNITKLEFLAMIQQIRKQAFKRTTIHSAFKKTGIWPLNPQLILDKVAVRAPVRTPSPTPSNPRFQSSSNFSTPVTLRQINKVARKVSDFIEECSEVDEEFSYDLGRFMRGSLILATELVQTKRDLSRTKQAELASVLRRAAKRKTIKSGGVLTVAEGRHILQQKAVDEVAKARQTIEAADRKFLRDCKKCGFEAAKKARKWRVDSLLGPLEIYDSKSGYRVVRRG